MRLAGLAILGILIVVPGPLCAQDLKGNTPGVVTGGLAVLIASDALLALSDRGPLLWAGVALWGLHMAMTQGLLSAMVAGSAPADLRGTAFGFFNLVSGVALLAASVVAGWLWDQWGASFTFWCGATFAAFALAGLARRPPGMS